MAGRVVLGAIRVQEVVQRSGRVSFTILGVDGRALGSADRFLRSFDGGTNRTYAYLLVDHLRWLDFEALSSESVKLADLHRYLGALGAEHAGPYGRPWRVGKRPYGQSSLETTAACLKSFYVFQGSRGVNQQLAQELERDRLPTKADRRRMFLGHVLQAMPANPLTPTRVVRRRHPKLPPEGARAALVESLASARDRLTVTWLAHGGFRIGELCGLHLADLHLREGAACGDCRTPHVHICHRETNPNHTRAKTKVPWAVEAGTVRGGLIRRASPAMIHSYFEYMTGEYPLEAAHGMLFVQLHGPNRGQPWSTAAARGMLRRAGVRLELGRIHPHACRHWFATNVLDASGGNTVIARDAGGWASAFSWRPN